MSINRALPRNVSFYDAAHPEVALGGFVQNGSITEANFLEFLSIILVLKPGPLDVKARKSNHIVSRTQVSLQIGIYDVYSDCIYSLSPINLIAQLLIFFPAPIQVSNEPWIPRLISYPTSGRHNSFQNTIRNRDRKCVISGTIVPEIFIQANNWTTFEAAHIIPPEQSSLSIQHEHPQSIKDNDSTESPQSTINSPTNGLLLRSDLQQMFYGYLISLNPDDGYKVVVFDIDLYGYDGKVLDPICRNPADPDHVSDDFLRWHFRQAVLANVRGAGEPIFEHDFPPGSDMLNEIISGPYANERFQLEMAARFQEVA